MRVFKPTYRDRRGETRELARWYVELKDADGIGRARSSKAPKRRRSAS